MVVFKKIFKENIGILKADPIFLGMSVLHSRLIVNDIKYTIYSVRNCISVNRMIFMFR